MFWWSYGLFLVKALTITGPSMIMTMVIATPMYVRLFYVAWRIMGNSHLCPRSMRISFIYTRGFVST